MYEDVSSSIMLDKTILNELVIENVIPYFSIKKFKGHLFRWPFFLLKCYKVKICQKDIVENHLKILALVKSLN